MHPRRFALIGGIIMFAIGVIAFIFPGSSETLPDLNIDTSYGLFLGLFPMNILNKIALIVLGLGGISAANARFTSLPMSIQYSRLIFYVMGVAAIFGIIPQTQTLYGYWPLYNGEVIMHGVFAIVGAYFGYVLTSKVPDSGPAIRDFTSPMKSSR
jgi:uncharacterized membrane protein HdeD (DUF308 family)